MDAKRHGEPTDINEIMKTVIADLKTKQPNTRGSVNYYVPAIERETTAARPEPLRHIDFNVGDRVQIRPNGKRDIGRVGLIIGIRYIEFDRTGGGLVYTVKFNDREANDYTAKQLIIAE